MKITYLKQTVAKTCFTKNKPTINNIKEEKFHDNKRAEVKFNEQSQICTGN